MRTSERREVFRAAGMPEPFATALAAVDRGIRNGEEDLVSGAVAELTGRAPRSLREFALAHSGTLV
ncbi:hypothetical protein [Saccharopolyspora gregorii]|uniref:Ergot alkaloid biosynthesis protein n=1 Tax=Saccharopolyspora gregorii TaxID=33914 RepID=A0ABP6RI25_9PSEU